MVRLLFGKSKLAAAAVAVAALLVATGQLHAQVGYTLDVTTHYQFSPAPSGALLPFGGPNPDTGFWTITNNGASTFTGTVGQVTNLGGGPNYNWTTPAPITLNPGDHITVAVNSESSNVGGYNGVTGTTENGLQINIVGQMNGTEAVNLSVFDKDIHSLVPRDSGGGLISDSYVLQGGNPLGFDTGDGFETTQADGHFQFFEQPSAATPEPASIAMLGMGALGMMGYVWRRKRQKTA
jgi:hypothetical protein